MTNKQSSSNPIDDALSRRAIEIRTSRCGDFRRALSLLEENPAIGEALQRNMITHVFPLSDINKAFEVARHSEQCIKVLIDTQLHP